MNQKAKWITLPEKEEETKKNTHRAIHYEEMNPVRNKFLWGVGFLALVIIVFFALAPNQFNSLIQGNLFDAQGGSETGIKVDLLTPPKSANVQFANSNNENTDSTASESEEDSSNKTEEPVSNNTVKPQDEAVTIAVEPIAPINCGTDFECFKAKIPTCSRAQVKVNYEVSDTVLEADLTITEKEGVHCLVDVVLNSSESDDLNNTSATCKIEHQIQYELEQIQILLSDPNQFSNSCSGEAVGVFKAYSDSLAAKATADAQAQLIADLNARLDELESGQNEESAPAIEDSNLKPSALESNELTPSNTQPPQFLQNPYRTSLTPEQVLQQNQNFIRSQDANISQPPANTVVSVKNIAPKTSNEKNTAIQLSQGRTPESGPTEFLLILAVMTYLGWIIKGFIFKNKLS